MTVGRLQAVSTLADGSGNDPVPLDNLGIVAAVVTGTTFPGGDSNFTCTIAVPPNFRHRALALGRRIHLDLAGMTVWSGRMDDPTPGQPWQVTGTGTAAMGADLLALTGPGNSNCYFLTDILDQAGSRGLPFVRAWGPSSDPRFVYGQTTPVGASGSCTVQDALNTVGTSLGLNWVVTQSPGNSPTVDLVADPTTPTYLLNAQTLPGRTLDGFATLVAELYTDSATNTYTVRTQPNTGAAALRGPHEEALDLTGLGQIAATGTASADSYGATILARTGLRAAVTATLPVQPGQLLNYPGGAPVDLALVRAGSLVRIIGLDPGDGYADVPVGPVDFIIGETSYAADTDVLELYPRQFQSRDPGTLLSQLVAASGTAS